MDFSTASSAVWTLPSSMGIDSTWEVEASCNKPCCADLLSSLVPIIPGFYDDEEITTTTINNRNNNNKVTVLGESDATDDSSETGSMGASTAAGTHDTELTEAATDPTTNWAKDFAVIADNTVYKEKTPAKSNTAQTGLSFMDSMVRGFWQCCPSA